MAETIAGESGIHSVAGAVIFAILYVPLFFFFIKQAIGRPTYVYIVTSLFCALRIAAFIIRAMLADVPKDGNDLSLFITFEVIYNVGFFGLLYSAYTLVLDRALLSDAPLPDGPISRITRRRPLFRIVLMAAVAVGITGAIEAAQINSPSAMSTGSTLRKVAVYLFLILSILVAFQTVLLIRAESSYGSYKTVNAGFGSTHGMYILAVISLLLVAREAFFTATSNDLTKQDNEDLWYPLSALTELIAVVLFAAPGLVPSRAELPT
ncbi:hypothetical protein SERLA73DRAFT_186027 [Serpula lacrymans var. lacrymans S7.3]|uniref:THH1/TOM1/TOM3 domain-containing protein n=2 Tax=Serpula lacrymans var. lacrymans TaxID=341189 RepID=F8Q6U3_SERL3|nr:uncharacterized protein SERLADRAFT_474863 [Serpula lacrymans var. lacrymans S7.9]EGN96331.1 hypothetical protein SERLA73DRAFT_186027 [Serpula lacrymans var. lacrymans S7.3]EGO21870.1 hypothetical protein SERLADRAFT_474863 [Serpula lacrymans var. lacrymans S7.9]